MQDRTRKTISCLGTLLLAVAGLAGASAAMAASFDCGKAKTAVEKQICADPELSVLDEYLGRYYSAARAALAHDATCLAGDQRNWLRTVRDTCTDPACLKRRYLQRLAVLDALQPGASSLRDIALPNDNPLVWIIPPALDEVAAPRDSRTTALVVRGKLRDEVADGDGFVIESTDGTRHLLHGLMFLESPTAEHLAGLARIPKTLYEARGRRETMAGDGRDFSPGNCAFVYRVSP